jgi:hypothetical protein
MEAFMRTPIVPVAILRLPRLNKPFITFAKAVHDHLKDNPSFPTPSPTLAVFAADIKAFDEAETKAATKAKGTAEIRNAKRRKVKEDLLHLRDYVQNVVEAQATVRDGASLIESAFMSVRQSSKRSRAELSAKNAEVSGTVVLDAKAVARTAAYYWQYSLDRQTWTSVPETIQAKTVIAGLTPATKYYFRFRALTRTGETDFSQVVSLLVH